MKYLLLIVFLTCIWWVWKKRQDVPGSRHVPKRKVENMLTCVYCGVHFPEDDGLQEDGQAYCCAAHLRAACSSGC